MPSSVLVRQALHQRQLDVERLRDALAVTSALAEHGERITAGPSEVAAAAQLVPRTGLPAAEVMGALRTLRESGLVREREGFLGVDPDVCCTLPTLAAMDWDRSREAIGRSGGRLAPALALLRELARLSRIGSDSGGDWLHPSVQELSEETLYGRTAVTQALRDLGRAELLIRADQPSRRGLRIRLHPRCFRTSGGNTATASPLQGAPASRPPPGSSTTADAGVTVRIGGASIGVPAGSRLQLPAGLDYRLEIGPDGGATIRIDD